MPKLIMWTNPISQVHHSVDINAGHSINAVFKRNHQLRNKPVVCQLNGEYILRKDWGIKLKQDDILTFVVVYKGGDTVQFIALFAAASFIVPSLIVGSLAGFAVGLGFLAVGLGLISFDFGVNIPNSPNTNSRALPSLSGQSNTIREGEAIPVVYGRVRVWPDLTQRPYSTFTTPSGSGDNIMYGEQDLHQTMVVGQKHLAISDMKFDDIPIENYSKVSDRILRDGISANDEHILFPITILQSQDVNGQSIESLTEFTGPFSIGGDDFGAKYLEFSFVLPAGLFDLTQGNSKANALVEIKVEEQGNAESVIMRTFDIGRGALLYSRFRTWQGSYINSAQDPIQLSDTETISSDELKQIDISIRRATPIIDHTNRKNAISLAGLLIRTNDSVRRPSGKIKLVSYDDVTIVQIRARATHELAPNSSLKFNCIAQSGSSNSGRSNIPNVFRDILTGDYGPKLSLDRIDSDALWQLSNSPDMIGYNFNGVIDQKRPLWDTLQTVAKAGLCCVAIHNGKIVLMKDRPRTIRSALFTDENMIQGSFAMEQVLYGEHYDKTLKFTFQDAANDYKEGNIFIAPDGSPATDIAGSIETKLIGVTSRKQAENLARYAYNIRQYQNRVFKFQTEMQALNLQIGDMIGIETGFYQYVPRSHFVEFSNPPIGDPSRHFYLAGGLNTIRVIDDANIGKIMIIGQLERRESAFIGSIETSSGHHDFRFTVTNNLNPLFSNVTQRTLDIIRDEGLLYDVDNPPDDNDSGAYYFVMYRDGTLIDVLADEGTYKGVPTLVSIRNQDGNSYPLRVGIDIVSIDGKFTLTSTSEFEFEQNTHLAIIKSIKPLGTYNFEITAVNYDPRVYDLPNDLSQTESNN